MKKYAWVLSFLLGLMLLVTGCKVGQFLDSPVAGLYYYTNPDNVRVTDGNGKFNYRPGRTVSFFVGDPDIGAIPVGEATGAAFVTPCDLTGAADELDAETTNIAILLQSLDADGNPANGIEITEAISDVVQTFIAGGGGPIDFDQDPDEFVVDPALVALFAALNDVDPPVFDEGGGEIRTPAQAQQHLNAALNRSRTTVTTDSGDVVGYVQNIETSDIDNSMNTIAWRGIPYAAPPVGELRWKAPVDPAPWTSPLYATEDMDVCTQFATNRYWMNTGGFEGSEDCLYLNIWRPDNDEGDLPVYFFIHGGSNFSGGAPDHPGHIIADHLNVVVVIIQYRLGPMGWFYDENLQSDDDDAYDESGNYGTMDHAKALAWVQNNIAGFGGNPDNVTLAGESAGGLNAMTMLTSPLGAGLFHKVVSQSAAGGVQPTEKGQADADDTLAELLALDPDVTDQEAEIITTVPAEREAYLRSKTAEEIRAAQDRVGVYGTIVYNPYIDGTVITKSWIQSIMDDDYNKVPIILGANKHEMKPFQALFPVPTSATQDITKDPSWLWVHFILQGWFPLEMVFPTQDGLVPTQVDLVLTQDDPDPIQDDLDFYDAVGRIGSRNWRAKYVDELADELIQQQENVYAYHFTWGQVAYGNELNSVPEPFDILMGAGHGMEIPFFFGYAAVETIFNYDAINDPNDPDYNVPGRADLSAKMMAYLGNFMRSGDPNLDEDGLAALDEDELISWPQWTSVADEDRLIEFGGDKEKAILDISDEHLTVADTWAEAEEYAGYVYVHKPDLVPYLQYIYWFMWNLPAPELSQ